MPGRKPVYANLAKFLFEMGDLKYVKRSGWWHAKIKDPESVAEHSFRAGLIAYVLGQLENHRNPERLAFIALIHDLPESRLLDLHKISASYVRDKAKIERRIKADQQRLLGFDFPLPSSNELVIVKDADLLEMAFTAREYMAAGHAVAVHLLDGAQANLQLESSKSLLLAMKKSRPSDWWMDVIRRK
ncbi:MAG: HD domain-containing protein [Candidatus Micrarchaeota archaeon]